MTLLITYDIADTKRRNKIATLLEGYGVRVNYSVFEVRIEPARLRRLENRLMALAGKHDSIRIYRFTRETARQSYELLSGTVPFDRSSGFV
jgi:CRISPR-associated protein Cas2